MDLLTAAAREHGTVAILTSLAIVGCTLAASIAAGLADRKRPFSLLRLTGARLGLLHRVIVWKARSRCSPSQRSRSARGSAPRRCSRPSSWRIPWWRRTPLTTP